MLILSMITILALSDSPVVTQAEMPVTAAIATTFCARQNVRTTSPAPTSAAAQMCPSDAMLVNEWLGKWEAASKRSKDRTRSEKEAFRQRVQTAFNEHAASASEKLIGTIAAKSLNADFFWRITKNTPYDVCLEAIPRDEMEQLFYGSIQVTLHAPTGEPRQLAITNRNEHSQIVWHSSPVPKRSAIQQARFEKVVPPSPSTSRVADRRID